MLASCVYSRTPQNLLHLNSQSAATTHSSRRLPTAVTDADAEADKAFLSQRPPWKCSICSVTCTSQSTLEAHAAGTKHRRRVSTSAASRHTCRHGTWAVPLLLCLLSSAEAAALQPGGLGVASVGLRLGSMEVGGPISSGTSVCILLLSPTEAAILPLTFH